MAQKRLKKRIREILGATPEGATAQEISDLIALKYNTEKRSPKKIGALCTHDPSVQSIGLLDGDNLYALKPKVIENETEKME